MASGEALHPDLVAEFYSVLPRARLQNLHGPTECAVDVSYWPCPRRRDVVPIGKPVSNTRLYVLDERLSPTPVGVPGELYLAGVQVGLGYHRRDDLTSERFVPDAYRPTHESSAARMYRTGDRARWRADGTVEYLGRLDFQVKVRGVRIELGEVEVETSFFELGGHSLLATRITAQLSRIFRTTLPLRRFFEAQTAAGVARTLTELELKPGQTALIARLLLKARQMSPEERELARAAPHEQTTA